MTRIILMLFLIFSFNPDCFSQIGWNLFGVDYLSFQQNSSWIKENGIKTIYEYEFLESNRRKLHIITRYNFDTTGLLISDYQSVPYKYKNWNIGDSLEYSYFRTYEYQIVDSIQLQITKYFRRLPDGRVDSISASKKYFNLNNVRSAKLNATSEIVFKYDSTDKCVEIIEIMMIKDEMYSIKTSLLYNEDLLTQVKQENEVKDMESLSYIRIYYNRHDQVVKMVNINEKQKIYYKYYYDRNKLIRKKKWHFEKSPSAYYLYDYEKYSLK